MADTSFGLGGQEHMKAFLNTVENTEIVELLISLENFQSPVRNSNISNIVYKNGFLLCVLCALCGNNLYSEIILYRFMLARSSG